jgi:hypothetical protein
MPSRSTAPDSKQGNFPQALISAGFNLDRGLALAFHRGSAAKRRA